MYKIIIKGFNSYNEVWFFHQTPEGNEYKEKELRDMSKEIIKLIKRYGKKNIKIIKQVIDGSEEDYYTYVSETTIDDMRLLDVADGKFLTYSEEEIKKVDDYIKFYSKKEMI